MVEYSQKWHNGTSKSRSTETSDGLAAIQAQLNNLGREIKKVNEKVYGAQVGCKQCKGPYYTKDCPLKEEGKTLKEAYYIKEKDPGSFTLPCFINNVCFDNSLVDLGANVSVMPLSTYLNLGLGELTHTKLTIELADMIVKYPKGIAENVLVGIGKFVFPVDFIILDMPEDIKVPLILERPFLSTARAKIDVYKRKITLRVGEERIVFTSVKPASSLIKRVYMLSLRERMGLDLEARLMGETLVINRSLDPLNGDYIELNNLNEPFELRRNQGDDLMPTIEEGEVIEEFRTRDDKLDTGIDDYPSYCDYVKKIHIDCTDNAKNHKKTVKTGQTWTREWKSTQRAGSFYKKVKKSTQERKEEEKTRSDRNFGKRKSNFEMERFKEMLRACPHHDQDSLNAAAGGDLLSKTTREALNIIENKSKVRYSRNKSNVSRMNTTSRENVSKTYERIDKLADQISTLVEIVSKKVVTPAPVKAVEETCVTCGGAHSWYNCPNTDNNQASVCATTGTYNQVAPPNHVGCRINLQYSYKEFFESLHGHCTILLTLLSRKDASSTTQGLVLLSG
ncbi:putative reverse transcriptase domain-containing protein [Tanacetum coccineum]|uniref:Reverse transcriptase domain-containing protein n=1 Tax=Tanacetum coccineum TaxID=301880 RepID=A0ABQ5DCI5_9ASTR